MVVTAGSSLVACDEESETGGGGTTSSSGTGGVASSSSSSSSTGTGGTPLLTCTEAYTSITDGDCELLNPLTTCPDGFWCDVQGVTAACVTVQGKGVKGPGQPCGGDSECAAGLSCQMDKCSPVCCPATEEPCLANSGACNIEVSLAGDAWVQMCSYLPSCTLLQDTCDGTDVCLIQTPSQCLSACVQPSGNAVGHGEECSYINDCGESSLCNNEDGTGYCRQLCDTTDWQTSEVPTGGCPPGNQCENLNTTCVDTWDHLGICKPTGAGGSGGGGGAGGAGGAGGSG